MSKFNPFTPGYGLLPPYLAGREQEQEMLASMLEVLAAGRPVTGVTVCGLRGMGKTTLLRWLEDRCADKKIRVVVDNAPTMLRSVDSLIGALIERPQWLDRWRVNIGNQWANAGVSSSAQNAGMEQGLDQFLIRRCRKRPMAVLVDEAHAPSDPDALRILLSMAQEVAQQSPFLLVLAGTPQLEVTLRNARATFIERAQSIELGYLDKEPAAAAIRVPMQKDGMTIAENALGQAVEDSQGYPFFIQQWGEALWSHAVKKGISELTLDDVNSVMPDIQIKRTAFYESRYREIKRSPELLAAANTLTQELLKGQQNLDRASIVKMVKNSLNATTPDSADMERKAWDITDELVQHDFFWQPLTSPLIVPGIPSFLTYVHNRITVER